MRLRHKDDELEDEQGGAGAGARGGEDEWKKMFQ